MTQEEKETRTLEQPKWFADKKQYWSCYGKNIASSGESLWTTLFYSKEDAAIQWNKMAQLYIAMSY